ncbi:hypothetical protein HY486_04405, partial [Candidatus Woesearchaeota archaeon]|nr:hypothetical protein [Candidatus Woesearchaeota archaeon]
VYLIAIDAWIHPYYLDYYNILIGGPKNVQEKNLLEFNWFGEGKKELVEWINKNTLPQAVVATKWNPSHDLVGWRNDIIELPLLESEFVGNPEYLAINHRYIQYDASKDKHALNMANYTLIKEIKAGGGTLGQVYKEKNEGKRTPQTVAIKVCDTRSGQCQNLRQKELSQALARTETKDYKYLNFTLLIGRIISQSS